MSPPRAESSHTTDSVMPLNRIGARVSWLRLIIGCSVALLMAGAATALYATQFARSGDVSARIEKHEDGDSPHPAIRKDLQSIEQRVIKIETLTEQASGKMLRIEDKVDRLIERVIPERQP